MQQENHDFTIEISKVLFQNFKLVEENQALDSNDLDAFKQQHIKPLYPHRIENGILRKYLLCQACCEETPGYFFCCNTSKPNESFRKFGLSICLYFKFLKHSYIFLSIISILSIISAALCYQVAIKNDINPIQNYTSFFFSTTYGAFSAENIKCKYSLFQEKTIIPGFNKTYQANFNVKCPSGQINFINFVLSNQNMNSIYNCRNEIKKISNNHQPSKISSYVIDSTNKTADGSVCNNSQTNSCQVTVNFHQNITTTNYSTVSYAYSCIRNQYFLAGATIKSQYLFYIVISFDILIIFFFVLFLASQNKAEENQEKDFKQTQATLSDYTLRLTGFKRKTAQEQLKKLFDKLKSSYPQEDFSKSIVACTFPESSDILNELQKKLKVYQQISILIQKNFFLDQSNKKLSFSQCFKKVFQGDQDRQKFKQYRNQLKRLTKKYIDFSIQKIEMQVESDENVSLFLTFDSIPSKQQILNISSSSCTTKTLQVDNRYYQIQKAPVPDMIQWQNRKKFTKVRVCISWMLTVVVCFGSYLLFGYIQYRQQKAFSTFNYGIDCTILFNTTQLTLIDNSLLTNNNYITCICKSQQLNDLVTSKNEYCAEWNRERVLNIFVPLLISLGIVLYNVIIMQIFKVFSRYEYHKFLIHEQISYTLKRSFVLISNMGVIMILLNFNFDQSAGIQDISILFTNRYDDFTPDWYLHIGSIIILTMIFNISTPIAEMFLSWTIKFAKKCWDKRCFTRPTSKQTKMQFIGLYDDDKFPISQRYAYLIALFMISFSFCGVIPILVPIAALSLFLLYFSDKILMFKIYQTPLNYSESIHSILNTIIYVSIVAHLALTSYFLSEPFLIQSDGSIGAFITSSNSRISDIFRTSYIIPYIVLLFLILIFLVINKCFLSLFQTIKSSLNKFASSKHIPQQKKNISLFSILSTKQAKDLLKLNRYLASNLELNLNNQVIKTKMIQKESKAQGKYIDKSQVVSNETLKKIIQNNIEALQLQRQDEALLNGARLIGLPSYEYLMNKNKLFQHQMMTTVQKQLRNILNSYNKNTVSKSKDKNTKQLPPSLIMHSHLFHTASKDASSVHMNKDEV